MRVLPLLALLVAVSSARSGAPTQLQAPPPPVNGAIAAILARPELRGTHWGIDVSNAATGTSSSVFQHNADGFFVPASNKKLLTTAAALLTHGPGLTFQTPLLLDETAGTVVLCGAGDPSISQHALQAAAQALATRLQAMLQRGNVSVLAVPPLGFDQDANPGSSSVDSWEWGDLTEDYGAQPSAFVVDALLPTNPSALGERMPNSMLLEIFPGTAIGNAAAVSFVAPAEAAFAAEFWTIDSTVSTSAAGTAAALHYWYPLDDTRTVRLDGSVPLGSDTVTATPHTIRIAAIDPATRAEGLLAAALIAAVNSSEGVHHRAITPVGPNGRAGMTTQLLRQQCSDARAEGTRPATMIRSGSLLEILNHTLQESDNTYAEMICRMQGLLATPADGS